jgi:hypothetical protein
MKSLFLATLVITMIPKTSLASITCLDGHEAIAAQKLTEILSYGVSVVFKKKKIAFDPSKIALSISATTFDSDNTTYGAFNVTGGTLVSASGTQFYLDFSGSDNDGADGQYLATYLPILTSKGFDKEGNPINPHCTLKLDQAFIANIAESFIIQNSSSGKIIGRVALPPKITLY